MESSSDPQKKYFDIAKPRISSPVGAPSLKQPKRQMINISDDQKPPEESAPKSNTEEDIAPFEDTLIEPDEAFEPTDSANSLSHPDLNVPDHIDVDDDKAVETEGNSPKDLETAPLVEDKDTPFVDPLPGTLNEISKEIDAQQAKVDENQVSTENIAQESTAEESATQQVTTEKNLEESEEVSKAKDETSEISRKEDDTPLPAAERFTASDALPDPGKTASDEAKQEMQDPKIFDTKEYYVPIGVTHHKHGSLKMAFLFGVICAVVVVGAIIFYVLKISK